VKKEEAFLCPFCGAPYRELIPAGTVQVKCRYCGATVLVPPRLGGAFQRCPNHPESLSVGFCNICEKAFCDKCLYARRERDVELYLCSNCLKEQYRETAYVLVFGALTMLIFSWLSWVFFVLSLAFLIAAAIFGTITPSAPNIYIKMRAREVIELTKKTDELYERLLRLYGSFYGGGRQAFENKIESQIESLIEEGLSREEAVRKLAEKVKLIEKE